MPRVTWRQLREIFGRPPSTTPAAPSPRRSPPKGLSTAAGHPYQEEVDAGLAQLMGHPRSSPLISSTPGTTTPTRSSSVLPAFEDDAPPANTTGQHAAAVAVIVAVCWNCRSTEHAAGDCPLPHRCYNCLAPGHDACVCVANPAPGSISYDPETTCHHCGDKGHATAKCKSRGGALFGRPGTSHVKDTAYPKPLLVSTRHDAGPTAAQTRQARATILAALPPAPRKFLSLARDAELFQAAVAYVTDDALTVAEREALKAGLSVLRQAVAGSLAFGQSSSSGASGDHHPSGHLGHAGGGGRRGNGPDDVAAATSAVSSAQLLHDLRASVLDVNVIMDGHVEVFRRQGGSRAAMDAATSASMTRSELSRVRTVKAIVSDCPFVPLSDRGVVGGPTIGGGRLSSSSSDPAVDSVDGDASGGGAGIVIVETDGVSTTVREVGPHRTGGGGADSATAPRGQGHVGDTHEAGVFGLTALRPLSARPPSRPSGRATAATEAPPSVDGASHDDENAPHDDEEQELYGGGDSHPEKGKVSGASGKDARVFAAVIQRLSSGDGRGSSKLNFPLHAHVIATAATTTPRRRPQTARGPPAASSHKTPMGSAMPQKAAVVITPRTASSWMERLRKEAAQGEGSLERPGSEATQTMPLPPSAPSSRPLRRSEQRMPYFTQFTEARQQPPEATTNIDATGHNFDGHDAAASTAPAAAPLPETPKNAATPVVVAATFAVIPPPIAPVAELMRPPPISDATAGTAPSTTSQPVTPRGATHPTSTAAPRQKSEGIYDYRAYFSAAAFTDVSARDGVHRINVFTETHATKGFTVPPRRGGEPPVEPTVPLSQPSPPSAVVRPDVNHLWRTRFRYVKLKAAVDTDDHLEQRRQDRRLVFSTGGCKQLVEAAAMCRGRFGGNDAAVLKERGGHSPPTARRPSAAPPPQRRLRSSSMSTSRAPTHTSNLGLDDGRSDSVSAACRSTSSSRSIWSVACKTIAGTQVLQAHRVKVHQELTAYMARCGGPRLASTLAMLNAFVDELRAADEQTDPPCYTLTRTDASTILARLRQVMVSARPRVTHKHSKTGGGGPGTSTQTGAKGRIAAASSTAAAAGGGGVHQEEAPREGGGNVAITAADAEDAGKPSWERDALEEQRALSFIEMLLLDRVTLEGDDAVPV